ncbi:MULTISPECIES: proteasome-type protease [unclassified Duganella]|uniref:proteasome-type protease n=1 Tax=unclassified Duganella TaxID=2636909 RepID=UPI0008850530|nr:MULTISPECIES: proteasome-type protease [unclassified Duganella]SDG84547.1 putative proteasome-type protease [Duganella sp. OV458]SDK11961.1 putative proteasome-type protease [Duganella sp. OV510]
MTYCVGMRLNAGLVFLSDSRTNAGVDQVGTFRKMSVFEMPGDRMMVMMTAGNLSISQSIRQQVAELRTADGHSIWTAPTMYEAARILGEAVRQVHERDAKALADFGIEFNVSIIFGGQIKGERCRLFQIYSAGNFIESHDENTYFQIGEAKYGKPIIDRVVSPATSLDDAAKCALISMDSTLRSNVSVGLPLDLLVYESDKLAVSHFVTIDERNEYFQMIRSTWGEQLKRVFEGLEVPVWNAAPETPGNVLHSSNTSSKPVRVAPPADVAASAVPTAPLQTLSQHFHDGQQ